MPCRGGTGWAISRCKQAFFETCLRTIVVTVEEHLQSKPVVLHGDFNYVNQDSN